MPLFQVRGSPFGRLGARHPALVALGVSLLGCKASLVDSPLKPPTQNPPVTAPAELRPVAGDSQVAPTGAALPDSLAVRVYDSLGNPYPGITVDWTLKQPGQLGQAQTLTDATGTSKNTWRLGSTPGFQLAVASSAALAPVDFVGQAILTLDSIAILPKAVTLQTGGTQQFSSVGIFSDGSTGTTRVTYSATGGVISTQGLYLAGSTPGTFVVVATQTGGTLADTATVSIVAAGAVLSRIILTPSTVSLAVGRTRQFNVTGRMSDGSTIAPPVTYTASGGTITAGGLYTAGSTAGTFRVIAVLQGGTLADTSAVTITVPPPPTLTQVILTPATVNLAFGGTQQFAVSGQWSDGSTTAPAVSYSATGGSITAGGLYTAGSTAGSFRVIAVQQGGTLADTSSVTVTDATITAITVTPAAVSLQTGQTQQFSAAATLSDGSTLSTPSVTWSATGGTITAAGLYTASGTTGSFFVTATSAAGPADTSAVTIVTGPPPGNNPNQPAGYTRVTEQPFNSATADSWYIDSGSPTFTAEATASISPSGIVRGTYPAGFSAGSGPWNLSRNLPNSTSLYYRFAFKHSANFQGENSGTNKIVFVWMHNNPSIFLSAEGQGSGNLVAYGRLQNVPVGEYLPPNRSSGVISRGVWHVWEVQLIANTPGVQNGTFRWWLDGVLVGDYTNIEFAGSGQSNTFQIMSIAPIWGGIGGTVTNTMTLDFDDMYASAP